MSKCHKLEYHFINPDTTDTSSISPPGLEKVSHLQVWSLSGHPPHTTANKGDCEAPIKHHQHHQARIELVHSAYLAGLRS